MILLTALLIALIFTTAAILTATVFRYKSKWLYHAVCISLAICLVSGVSCVCIGNGARNDAAWLKAESANIQLYYNTIVYSDNEYVRYDFYDRVVTYNHCYEAYQNAVENPWTSWLFDADVLTDCAPIDFALNTGTYG
jgi:hypothetical protein